MRKRQACVYGLLLLFCTLKVLAVTQSAFTEALGFAHKQQGSGIEQLKTFNPMTIFGKKYTSHPDESHHYGGVTQSSCDLMNQGYQQFTQTQVGQSVTGTLENQPNITISGTSDFVQAGQRVKDHSTAITTGKYKDCHKKVIHHTDSSWYRCVQPKITNVSCLESSTIEWRPVKVWEAKTETGGFSGTTGTYTSHTAGIITTVRVQADAWKHHHGGYFDFSVNGHRVPTSVVSVNHHYYDHQGIYQLTGQHILSPGYTIDTRGDMEGNVSVVLTLQVQNTHFRPEVIWQTGCPFDGTEIVSQCVRTQHVCTRAGSTKTTTDGKGRSAQIHQDCWGYKDIYRCGTPGQGTCGQWQHNPNCNVATATCTQKLGKFCLNQQVTYLCQHITQAQGMLCGTDFYCMSGQCDTGIPTQNKNFGPQVSRLAGAAGAAHSAAQSANGRQDPSITVHAFTGQAMSCRYDAAGFSNCCSDSGWGHDTGLAHCSSEEKLLGKAKEKHKTVKVGTKCDNEVLGVCISHSKVYCVFDNILAMIIQTQGRSGQLHIGFGSGKHPDCRGLTVQQLQSIDFDQIDFSAFYPQLKQNLNIPGAGDLIQKVKDQINHGIHDGGGHV